MSLLSDIAALRASNATDITAKTAANSITPIIVGGEFDTVCDLLVEVDGLLSSAGDLQAVTTAGNTTTNDIIVEDGSNNQVILDPLSVSAASPIVSGIGKVLMMLPQELRYKQLSGAGNKTGDLQCVALTTNRVWQMPDESVSGTQDNWVMLHNSTHPVLVGTGTLGAPTTGVLIDGSPSVVLAHGGTIYGRFKWNGTQAALSLADAASPNTFDIIAGTLSAARTGTLPDYSGTFYMNYGGTNSQGLVGAATMTIPFTCPFVPSRVMVTPKDAGAGAAWAGSYVSAITGAHFVITFPTPLTATCTFDYQLFP